jgi:translocation and assembly module TamB
VALHPAFNRNPQSGGSQPSGKSRRLFRVAKWVATLIVVPILIGLAIVSFLLNTGRGHAFLINFIQNQAARALGAGVHLENFSLHLSDLSVDLYGLRVDGASPYPTPPLLQIQHAEGGIRIVSFLQRKWYFDNIRIDNPVAQILVDKDGISNLPTFKSSNTSSNESIFDLGIRHAVLANGMVIYNDRPMPLTLDLRSVNFESSFNSLLREYSGTLTYADGRINYAGTQAPPHNLSVTFDATPDTLHLSPAKIESGKTQLALIATVNNYAAPVVQAQYKATVDGQQLAGVLRSPSIPAGLVSLSGTARYQSRANHTLLQSLAIDGDISSSRLTSRTASIRTEAGDISGHYSLANGDATLHDFRARLLGGEVTAQGTMKNIGGDAHSNLAATLRGISLAAAQRTFGSIAPTGSVALSGTLNGTATAAWGKTLADLVAHADATINAGVQNGQGKPNQPPQMRAQAGQSASANSIPVESALHATYSAKRQQVALDNSYLRTPQTNLAMNGTLSKNSSLSIQLQANDLREVETIADLFHTSAPGQPVQQPGLAGTASFTGVVRGSTSAPHVTGRFSAQSVQIQGSSWKQIRADIDADPSHVNLQRAEIEPASQGRITMNAGAQLHNWSFSQSSPIVVQLNASQLELSEVAKLAGQQVPVSGTLAANVAVHGSVLNPIGTGNITLAKAAAYGEPITSAKVTFNGTGDQARANLAVAAPAGTINAVLSFRPRDKTYSAKLASSGIDIAKLHSLKTSNLNPSGVVAIDASGQGSLDNPQLDANIQIPNLSIQQQKISDIRLKASVANHLATAQLTSSAVNTAINANAKVSLTGDYPADATLDTQGIPLGPLVAAYLPDQAANITGQTEIHATLHGPLKNREQLEAHVTIPQLKLAYGDSIQLAEASPIRADYKDGIITIQRSSIRGTDTDLQFQGTIPTSGGAPMSLLLLGSVDLHLVQLFDPDLRTSGQLKFNVNSNGTSGNPDIAGTIDVVEAAVNSPDLPVGLQHGNGTLSVKRNRIDISSFKGNIGGGTITAQGGVALSPSIQFDLGAAAHDVRMLYPQGMRESINANIRLTGSTQSAVLGGTVNLTDLSFTRAFDLNNFINQFSGGITPPPSQGFSQNIALNLAVHSSSNLNLVSRTLSIAGSANLQVRGTVAEPVILGRINLTSGDIILNGDRFVLSGGTIQFVNPSVTEPVVNLNLTTTIQQYNINLRFQGPVEQMRTQYTSNPALPTADIIHLLAFGQTTEAASASATPTNQAAQSLVANQVSSQITSRISRAAGISQLSISPVLSSGSGGISGANITVQQRITSNLFVTFSGNPAESQGQTIQGQYQVTPRVAVSATRDPNGGFGFDTLIKKSW